MRSFIDLTGMRFGRLIVVSRYGYDHRKQITWKCICDCGNETISVGYALRRGSKRSCGCILAETRIQNGKKAVKSLLGKSFGYLVVLARAGSKYREAAWLCQCRCGNTVIVNSRSLVVGHTKSCGCWMIESITARSTKHGLSYTPEYKRYMYRLYYDRKKYLDTEWTLSHEKELIKFFPVCVVCGSVVLLAVDHVYPASKGFGLCPGNAVRLCKSCNSTKNNKMPEDLSDDIKDKILLAAESFRLHWENIKKENECQVLVK